MTRDSDILIIASATAKPGKEAELISALRAVAGPTRVQPGCLRFGLYRTDSAGATIVGIERWASAADHERHLAGANAEGTRRSRSGVEPPGMGAPARRVSGLRP